MARTRVVPEPLTFEEALEFWRDKVPVTPAEFARLASSARAKAFTIAGVAKMDLLLEVMRLIEKAIDRGITLEEFRAEAAGVFKAKGWVSPAPYRLDNIFRTNIQTAYMVGRYTQMTDPAVLEDRPYWMYDAVNDSRTRPSHLVLDEAVYPADHSFWDTWYPPNGYRCRCVVRALSGDDVRRRGLVVQRRPPGPVGGKPLLPDPGFGYNPAKAEWTPDLSKYPAELREAFTKAGNAK